MFQSYSSRDQESRRPWAFSISLLTQALAVAVALLIPLLSEPMLPTLGAALVSLQAPPLPRSSRPPQQQVVQLEPQRFDNEFRQPRTMPPSAVRNLQAEARPEQGPFIPSTEPGESSPVFSFLRRPMEVAPPVPPEPEPRLEPEPIAIPVGGDVQAARLVHRVTPEYPLPARSIRIQGIVLLRAVIAPDGTIAELEALEGHPWLVQAALNAVRQWRYRPTVLNGRPVPVNTEIKVNFTLDR